MADPASITAGVSLLISLVALGVSGWSAWKTVKLRTAQVEAQVRGAISTARKSYEDLVASNSRLLSQAAAANLPDDEQGQLEIVKGLLASREEDTVNAYEDACAKYLDGKLDAKRFKKSYRTEIRQLVEDPTHKKYFDGVTSRFKAILAVYSEWENLEK